MKQKLRYYFGFLWGRFFFYFGFVNYYLYKIKKNKQILAFYFYYPSSKLLERLIIYAKQKGFKFITTDELCRYVIMNERITDCLIHFSIDDARNNFLTDVYPIITKHNILVTLFIPTLAVKTGSLWWTNMHLKEVKVLKSSI